MFLVCGNRHAIPAGKRGENVNASEGCTDRLLQPIELSVNSAIGNHTECLGPHAAHGSTAVVDSSLVTSDDDHGDAVGGQSQSGSGADAPRTSGHHCDFACQVRVVAVAVGRGVATGVTALLRSYGAQRCDLGIP